MKKNKKIELLFRVNWHFLYTKKKKSHAIIKKSLKLEIQFACVVWARVMCRAFTHSHWLCYLFVFFWRPVPFSIIITFFYHCHFLQLKKNLGPPHPLHYTNRTQRVAKPNPVRIAHPLPFPFIILTVSFNYFTSQPPPRPSHSPSLPNSLFIALIR